MNDQSPRRLPQWAWGLAVLFFPSGFFMAFGCARLLSWSRAILFTLLSYGCIIGFVQLMIYLEHRGASDVIHFAAILTGIAMLSSWGLFIFRIGQRVEHWSPTELRSWHRAGWFAVAIICIGCVVVAVQFFSARGHSS